MLKGLTKTVIFVKIVKFNLILPEILFKTDFMKNNEICEIWFSLNPFSTQSRCERLSGVQGAEPLAGYHGDTKARFFADKLKAREVVYPMSQT